MENKFILGLISLVFLTLIGVGCRKEAATPSSENFVFASKIFADTVVSTPSTAFLFKGSIVDHRGAHIITRATIAVNRSNGFLISDIKNLKIRFTDNRGQVFEHSVQNVSPSNSFELGLPFGTDQSAEIEVTAFLDPVHNGAVQVDVDFFYSGPLGSSSKKLFGPRIRCETSTVLFIAEERKPLSAVLTSSEPEVYGFSLKSEGLSQELSKIVFKYNGTLGHESVTRLMLFTKQGVKLAEATNISGVFTFSNISDDLSSLKEYVVKAVLRQGIRTGDRWTASLVSIETEDTNGDLYEIKTSTPLLGNEFVTFASLVEVKTNPLPNTKVRNGEVVLSSHTFTAKGGNASLSQFKQKLLIADNGIDSTISVSGSKVRINGSIVQNHFVSFSKTNGNIINTHTESDDMVYTTILGGQFLQKDVPVTIEFIGTLKGIGVSGDVIATTLVVEDELDLGRRYITRAPNQQVTRLHTSPSLSTSGVVYDFLWSDRSSTNPSGITGISSPDWLNGRFIDTKHLYASVLQ